MNPNQNFSSEQKEYLSGFFAGVNQRGPSPFVGQTENGTFTADSASGVGNMVEEETVYGTPVEDLCKEERYKHELNGLDCYDRIVAHAAENKMPTAEDVFYFKYYGLFDVRPAQDHFMLRGRVAGGLLKSYQLEGLAEVTEELAGGYADLTTRGNYQFREIEAKNAAKVLERIVDLGLNSRGSGADNLRNVTSSATSGIDSQEIYDTRELAKAMHHLILNTREFYGLPRKFNISFDGGGTMSVCADTNDIAFYAVKVEEGHGLEAGIYFRVQLAGITGHKQFATDSGILIKPEECLAVASAILRVFIENGDRTNRGKSRLKYVIDKWGIEKFVAETEKELDFDFLRFPLANCIARLPVRRLTHVGAHKQVQAGLSYLGVIFPVGRMTPPQMKAVARLSNQYGNGEIRLTVWQNLLIPNIRDEDISAVKAAILDLGLICEPHNIGSGVIACTGAKGCKFAACDTKGNALELIDYLGGELESDQPLNIHVTGCAHSCAQHYIGDIGMQATKVKVDGESVEGYHVVLGGGVDDEQGIAKEVFKAVPFTTVKPLLKNIVTVYQSKRNEGETFPAFNRRFNEEQLRDMYTLDAVNA